MPDLIQSISPYRVMIITGASSGIGRCFVKLVSELNRSIQIINLSRSEPTTFPGGPRIVHRPTDLSRPEEIEAASGWLLDELGKVSDGQVLLINNSGFGSYGFFPEPCAGEHAAMISVNVTAPVLLTARLLPELRRRGGAVLNIASTAAFQPTPYMATYGATKAFILNWSLALQEELRPAGITVLAVCPGPTESNFFRRAGFSTPPMGGFKGQTAPEVVEEALKALARRRSLVVTGWKNRLVARASSMLPKTIQARISGFVLRKLRLERHLKGR